MDSICKTVVPAIYLLTYLLVLDLLAIHFLQNGISKKVAGRERSRKGSSIAHCFMRTFGDKDQEVRYSRPGAEEVYWEWP